MDAKDTPSQSMVNSSRIMSVDEVAKLLSVHHITIYRLIRQGFNLGQFKIGRVWRFSTEGFQRFIDEQGRLRRTNS